MSLAGYQQALADLIGSPARCQAARRAPEAVLAPYELDARERARVIAVVGQKGMSVNCSLYRSNRVTPIYTLLHFSCLALGERLEAELDAYWEAQEFSDLQFKLEIERFAEFLKGRVATGALRTGFLPELLDFELARNELRFLPRRRLLAALEQRAPPLPDAPCELNPLTRIARFPCDAAVLLGALANGAPIVGVLPPVESYVILSALRTPALEVLPMETGFGRALWSLQCLGAFCGSHADFHALAGLGIIVRAGG